MTFNRCLLGTTALWMITAGIGAADVSAQDVWTDWKASFTNYGSVTNTGMQRVDGDTLTIEGATIEGITQDGSYTIALPLITMVENSNGTVTATMGDTSSITAVFPTELGRDGQVVINMETKNYVAIASGSPDAFVYDMTADKMAFSASEMTMGSITMSFVLDVVMEGVTGKSTAIPGNLRDLTQVFTVTSTTGKIDFEDPAGTGHVKATFNFDGTTGTTAAQMPTGVNVMDTTAVMGSGYALEAGLTHSGFSMQANVEEDGEAVLIQTASSSGTSSISTTDKRVDFSVASMRPETSITTSQFPFPIEFTASAQEIELGMPVAASDAAQEFGLDVALRGFEVNEMLWGMVDPSGALPRDPATIAFEIDGKAKLNVDLSNPDFEDLGSDAGQLNALNLKSLVVDAVGAKLTGDGAFTFDNTDLTTFDGMPKPTGALNLKLVGINGLMDKLSSVGLLPPEQAMGARMMMGMFARPGDGPDTLTSKIEINDAGQVLANGQRIR